MKPGNKQHTMSNHLYSDSCCYCHHDAYTFGEDASIAPESCRVEENMNTDEQPFPYNYLLNLFTAPNMGAFLAETSFTDDVYALPIHLQRLISEAKEEVILERTKASQGILHRSNQALNRLEDVRKYVWMRSGGDVANLMAILTHIVSDEDELQNLVDH
ncbi:hypothetical protein EC973_006867 [Apophysomyces ossiformis]|uniref:Uncharacterized protein n=1 Tax=Apophysomyces ossiformis TaxID=679940 RepID=A0A8H7BVG7_9FUNG|nr:hypothetical protein EC973_006867 [Apophysomyces ossiformis]